MTEISGRVSDVFMLERPRCQYQKSYRYCRVVACLRDNEKMPEQGVNLSK